MASAKHSSYVVCCAYVTLFTMLFTTIGLVQALPAQADAPVSYNFNSGDQLTNNFTPDTNSEVGNFATTTTGGLDNSGAVSLVHDDGSAYVTKESFAVPGNGETLAVGAYFKYERGESCCYSNGSASLGFVASTSANYDGNSWRLDEASLVTTFDEDYFELNSSNNWLEESYFPELISGQWYKVVMAMVGTAEDDIYDIHAQIWNSDEDGNIYSLRSWITYEEAELITTDTGGNVYAVFAADMHSDVENGEGFTLLDNFDVNENAISPLWDGSGSEQDPYIVESCADLQAINADPETGEWRHFKIGDSDIDCSDTVNWNGGEGFIPIGYDSKWGDFNHFFDGNYKAITDLTINRDNSEDQGLIRNIGSNGVVRNLFLRDFSIQVGQSYSGALAGTNDGLVEQVGVENATVLGNYYVGGLVGENYGDINRSYVIDSEITANGYVGGLIGYSGSGYIEDSYVNAIVTSEASGQVGGLIGNVQHDTMITRSFAISEITNSNEAGGLIGSFQHPQIANSFAVSSMSNESAEVGGLAGYTKYGDSEDVYNNFYYNEGEMECVGYMDSPEGEFSCDSVDSADYFKNISNQPLADWTIELSSNSSYNVNDGYPVLAWQATEGDTDAVWLGFSAETAQPEQPRSSSSGGRANGGVQTAPSSNSVALIQQIIDEIKKRVEEMIKNGETVSPAIQAFLNGLGSSANTIGDLDLEYGDEGPNVAKLQTLLMAQGYSIPAGATGYFLDQTRTALIAYQKANSISPAVGYFGAATRAFMKAAGLPGLWW